MKTVLIDDQPNIREQISSFLAPAGYDVNAAFHDKDRLGYLGYIAQNMPDVILLAVTGDIRLDFITKTLRDIRSVSMDCAIILLADRYDCTYTQLILEFEAVGTLNTETELKLLPMIMQKIDEKRQSKKLYDRENLYRLFSDYMKDEQRLSYQEQQYLFRNYADQPFFRVAVVRTLLPYRKRTHLDETNLVFLKGYEILLKRLRVFHRCSVRRYGEDTIVCFMGDTNTMERVEPALNGFLKDMAEFSQTVSHSAAWVFLGKSVSNIREVSKSYQSACKLVDERIINAPFTIIRDERMSGDTARDTQQYQIFDVRKSLVNALITYDENTIRKSLTQLKSNIASTADVCGTDIKSIYKTLCYALQRELERNETAVDEFSADDTVKEFEYFWDVDNVFRTLENLYSEGSKKLRELEENSLPAAVVLAKRYIRSYFNMPLTLREISEYVGMNENYFSDYFKKYTSQSFKRYQIDLRIRHAKQMLLDKQYTMEDIAEAIGYADIKYFSRVFKQETGIAPGEYRKKYHVISD